MPVQMEEELMYTDDKAWYFEDAPQFRHVCSRALVFAFSALLAVLGLGLIGVGIAQATAKIVTVCPYCTPLTITVCVLGSVFALFGLLGFCAARCRSRVLALFFVCALVLVMLASAGVAVAGVVFKQNRDVIDIENLWLDAVRDDPADLCDLQRAFDCSGYTHSCAVPVVAPTQCPAGCTPSNATVSCEQQLVDSVDRSFGIIIGVSVGVFVLALAMAVASVRMVLRS